MTADFEEHAQQTEGGVEYWLARDLQHLLGYTKWDNFLGVFGKAKTACEVSGHVVADHFADVGKMVDLGSGSQREIDDIMLTRYACYLIAQNGDPRKSEIAFAQTYFAIQTRRAELIEQRLLDAERVSARKKLSATEKELSDVIFEQTGGNNDFALIRSQGDQALFGKSTQAMKAQWKVPGSRPLADFAPTIILKAKDFAAEIMIFNARQHGMHSESVISREHATNNQAVRNTLLEHGIRPEYVAGGGGCEESGTPTCVERKEVAQESGRSRFGGAVVSEWLNDAKARKLEQTIAANVAGILGA
jgi:DNA-damage-inducible protein D